MPTILVNPLDETPRERGQAAPRLKNLQGKTIVLLDISKPGGKFFLDCLEEMLTERYAVGRVLRESKPTYTKLAPRDLISRLTEAEAVIEALAD
ncbi:MAG: hypothetical protein ACE5MK_11435 [Acidobacteriota bacterium]